MAQANLYPGVYYGLGQFIPPQATLLYTHDINHDINSIERYSLLKNYLIFQQVTEDSALSGKLSEKAKLTELKY